MSFSRIIGVVPGALAFLAVALLVLLQVCSALDAHAAAIPADDANSCCVIVEGVPIKAPSVATGDRSSHSDIEHRSSGTFLLNGPSGAQALGSGSAPRARSYCARSARILR